MFIDNVELNTSHDKNQVSDFQFQLAKKYSLHFHICISQLSRTIFNLHQVQFIINVSKFHVQLIIISDQVQLIKESHGKIRVELSQLSHVIWMFQDKDHQLKEKVILLF